MTVEWLDGITDIFSDVTSLRCRISIIIRNLQAIEWQEHQQSVVKPKDAITSYKNTGDTVPYFGSTDLLMTLLLWSPFLPISKLIAIQDHAKKTWRNNFEWRGGGRCVIYPTDVWLAAIWSKKGRFFVFLSVSTFLQLFVVAREKLQKEPRPSPESVVFPLEWFFLLENNREKY